MQAPKSPLHDYQVPALLVAEGASWIQESTEIGSQHGGKLDPVQSLLNPLMKDIDLMSVTRQCKQGNDTLKSLTRQYHLAAKGL